MACCISRFLTAVPTLTNEIESDECKAQVIVATEISPVQVANLPIVPREGSVIACVGDYSLSGHRADGQNRRD